MRGAAKAYLYNTFADGPYCGNRAIIVPDASEIDKHHRQLFAQEMHCVCAFLDELDQPAPRLQFFTEAQQIGMCGHATLAVTDQLLEATAGSTSAFLGEKASFRVDGGTVSVGVSTKDSRREFTLELNVAPLSETHLDASLISRLIGASPNALHPQFPMKLAKTGLRHLVVPLVNSEAVNAAQPEFTELGRYCREHDIDSVAVFAVQILNGAFSVELRDLCPAIGVNEEPASGTTTAAACSYIHNMKALDRVEPSERMTFAVSQGLTMGRKSRLTCSAELRPDNSYRCLISGSVYCFAALTVPAAAF